MTKLALFDLDYTLIPTDSDSEWIQYMVRHGLIKNPEDFMAQSKNFYSNYISGCLDIHAYIKFSVTPITTLSREELKNHHKHFMQESILPKIVDDTKKIVNKHLERGDLCCIITATNSFIATPIAEAFNIKHVLAVNLETENNKESGKFLAKIKGIPSFQKGKIERAEQWLASFNYNWDSFSESYFYSDSHNDIPLLEKVTNPIAVNPDPKLYRYASEHGWKIIEPFKKT